MKYLLIIISIFLFSRNACKYTKNNFEKLELHFTKLDAVIGHAIAAGVTGASNERSLSPLISMPYHLIM